MLEFVEFCIFLVFPECWILRFALNDLNSTYLFKAMTTKLTRLRIWIMRVLRSTAHFLKRHFFCEAVDEPFYCFFMGLPSTILAPSFSWLTSTACLIRERRSLVTAQNSSSFRSFMYEFHLTQYLFLELKKHSAPWNMSFTFNRAVQFAGGKAAIRQ